MAEKCWMVAFRMMPKKEATGNDTLRQKLRRRIIFEERRWEKFFTKIDGSLAREIFNESKYSLVEPLFDSEISGISLQNLVITENVSEASLDSVFLSFLAFQMLNLPHSIHDQHA